MQLPRGAERAPRGRRSVRRGREDLSCGPRRGPSPGLPSRPRPAAGHPSDYAAAVGVLAPRAPRSGGPPQKGLALLLVPMPCVVIGGSGVTSGIALVVPVAFLPSEGSFLPGVASFGA